MSSRARKLEPTIPAIRLGEKKLGTSSLSAGDWSREVEVGDRRYRITLRRGQRVRIAYKPAGSNWGYRWMADVWRADVRAGEKSNVWSGEVAKSAGVRGILLAAGVVTTQSEWWKEFLTTWFWIGSAIHRREHPQCVDPEDARFGRTEYAAIPRTARFERRNICQLTCTQHEEGYKRCCPCCGAPFKRRPSTGL